jgi:DNA-directed RNA polymerase subunit alpha
MISNHILNHPPIKTKLVTHGAKNTLTIEPLLPGFGHTLGNSLRRIFLSSIPGFAVTKIKINDLTHEYQPISGVVEDAMDVVLNLKLLRCKILTDDDKVTLTLTKNEKGEVTARDFEKNSKVEIVNPDLYICYLDKNTKLEIEVEVNRGVGYLAVEEINLGSSTNPQEIWVDALFSPVTNVSFEVEKVRVGDKTNFDRIEISFDTDGSVEAKAIVEYALNLAVDLFSKIKSSFDTSVDIQTLQATAPVASIDHISAPSLASEEIDLPARIKNILEKNGITTNSQLKARISEIEDFPGVAEKAITTIKDYIKSIS